MKHNFTYNYMIEILTALKEGKDVQYRAGHSSGWVLHDEVDIPNFDKYEYRIKPDTVRCKVGLFKDETNFMYADLIQEYAFERTESDNESFVRWLTDVIEYNEKL